MTIGAVAGGAGWRDRRRGRHGRALLGSALAQPATSSNAPVKPTSKRGTARIVEQALRSLHLGLQIVLQTGLVDQPELGLEPVDVLLLALEDVLEQLAG